MKFLLALLFIAVFFLEGADASAAPFCVEVQGASPECYYYDADQCSRRANQLSGLCNVNIKELKFPSGIGSFCLVTGGGVSSCLYPDSGSCSEIARKNKGVCVRNPARRAPAEPFRYNSDVFY